ncbi:hypothetical protein PMEGAPL125_24410 [Priestia megaterium]
MIKVLWRDEYVILCINHKIKGIEIVFLELVLIRKVAIYTGDMNALNAQRNGLMK